MTSKVKGQGRQNTWCVWQVLADKSTTKSLRNIEISRKVAHPTGNRLDVKRSRSPGWLILKLKVCCLRTSNLRRRGMLRALYIWICTSQPTVIQKFVNVILAVVYGHVRSGNHVSWLLLCVPPAEHCQQQSTAERRHPGCHTERSYTSFICCLCDSEGKGTVVRYSVYRRTARWWSWCWFNSQQLTHT